MSAPHRVFLARLAGMHVFDRDGDPVGIVRDVVATLGSEGAQPRVIGLVVEVPGRRRVFLPLTRVTSIDVSQVITTGLINVTRFQQRPNETLVIAELLDRNVTVHPDEGGEPIPATIEDLAMDQVRTRDWVISKAFVRKATAPGRGLSRLARRRGEALVVDLHEVRGLQGDPNVRQAADKFLETMEEMLPADLAEALTELSDHRRTEVIHAMNDEQLADVLEELPEEEQIEIIAGLESERAADVLEVMEPDDAADLLAELPEAAQEKLLALMEPEESAPLRRLLAYDENTAGGLMTPEPVILGPDAAIAEALAQVRRPELSPAVAASVFVCRPPLEAPTGRFLGMVHFQALLREPPSQPIGNLLDKDPESLTPDVPLGEITRRMATYNVVILPVVDEQHRLLGAVTVDDVLDHMLPEDWRESRDEVTLDG